MSTSALIALFLAAWLVVVVAMRLIGRRLARGPRGDAITGLLWLLFRAYCRLVHRARFDGREHVPDTNAPGGLIVVSNHTGPVDPLLIQAGYKLTAFKEDEINLETAFMALTKGITA